MDIGKAGCLTEFKIGDKSQDLAIVQVSRGQKTPLQNVLNGNKTIEGFLEDEEALTVRSKDGRVSVFEFGDGGENRPAEIGIGKIMQWAAHGDSGLTFYEICDPPYQGGRYETLSEGTAGS